MAVNIPLKNGGSLSLLSRDTGKKDTSEAGSVSILILGLFFLMLALVYFTTDVASVIVAQRSLVSASENAVIQAAHALDRASYYRGGTGVSVPLDCVEARHIVLEELRAWVENDRLIRRPELLDVQLENLFCVGDEVEITTAAEFQIPLVLPSSQFQRITLRAKVGARSQATD